MLNFICMTCGVQHGETETDAPPEHCPICEDEHQYIGHAGQRALQAGAMGYLLKESAGEEVVEAIRTIHRGRRYLSRKIAETVAEDYVRQGAGDVLGGLSSRERQVLQLIAEGKTSAEAAQILYLSVKTVETYRSRFIQNLGVKDTTALVKFAIQQGIISLEQ